MLNKIIPSSLFARFVLIIIIPTILAQLIATYMFYNRHWYSVSKNMAYSLYNDIQLIYDSPPIQQKTIQEKLNIRMTSSSYAKNIEPTDYFSSQTELLYKFMKKTFPYPVNVEIIDDNNTIKVEIFLTDKIVSFFTNSKRVDNPTTYIFILWMTGTSIIFLLLSIIFTKNQIRPIIKLARAADKFGKGQNIHLKEEGAREIRKASAAFLKMKERVERQITYRTEMLAGVSHDLRTPITRIKLQIEMSKDDEVKQILEDVKDMEYMIDSYINFARGNNKEPNKVFSFNKFLFQILSSYKDKKYTIKNCPKVKISLKANAIKRCFQNLFDNSFKYGSEIIINSYVIEEDLYIEIHDNGCGIPESKREDVFKPFFRLDESRNKDNGGVGLGLAITKDIISNHGGNIYLEDSEILKGLKAIITLPL